VRQQCVTLEGMVRTNFSGLHIQFQSVQVPLLQRTSTHTHPPCSTPEATHPAGVRARALTTRVRACENGVMRGERTCGGCRGATPLVHLLEARTDRNRVLCLSALL
jgi:hypothetical protein